VFPPILDPVAPLTPYQLGSVLRRSRVNSRGSGDGPGTGGAVSGETVGSKEEAATLLDSFIFARGKGSRA
jgi:hypothetical protein